MNKTIQGALLLTAFTLFLGNCGSTEKKDTPDPAKDSDTTKVEEPSKDTAKEAKDSKDSKDAKVADAKDSTGRGLVGAAAEELFNQLNETLKTLRYPDGKSVQGFAYKKWEIPNKKDFVNWVKLGGSSIKKGLDELPAVYNLEIAGHTDTVGPEEPVGDKKGNIFYSEQRAKEVKQALVKLGLPEKRIVTKAMGSSNPIPGIEGESGLNRRVTFKFVLVEPTDSVPFPGAETDTGK